MIIHEEHGPRVILDIEQVPVYLGFLLAGSHDTYGEGPYIIINSGSSKKICHVLNCKTHVTRTIPWGTKVILIKINLTWMYAKQGENL